MKIPNHSYVSRTLQQWSRRQFSKKILNKKEEGRTAKRKDGIIECGPEMVDRGICVDDPCNPEECLPQPKVVIIGAGVAGISAAARLAQKGITNFTVLEALERPGGRIHSCWFGDIVAEMGANWKQDNSQTHPIFTLSATEEPARPGVPAAEYPRGLLSRVVPGTTGFPIAMVAYQKFRQIEQETAQIYCLGGNKQQGSLINFMSIRIQQELHDFPEEHRHDAARIFFGLVHMLIAKGGSDTSMLCADNSGCFMNLPGGEVRVPLGLIGVLAPMLCQIPEGTIRYCKRVDCIYWGSAKQHKSGRRVIISTTDGEEFSADYVIITVSLGVLQQNSVKMFCPALPASKMDAMRCLGFGYCNKVFLEYYRPFWVWHKGCLKFSFNNDACDRCDWTRGITEIAPVSHSKHVLGVYLSGPEAMWMEAQGDQDVVEGVTDVLRRCTGCSHLPYPKSIIRSHWTSSPFFCGAYSYNFNGSEGEAQRALACPLPGPSEPVPPMLLFAGEATVPGHYATIGGARISGIREAERIVQLTLRYKGPPDIILDQQIEQIKTKAAANK